MAIAICSRPRDCSHFRLPPHSEEAMEGTYDAAEIDVHKKMISVHLVGVPSIAWTSLRVTISVMGSSGDGSKPRAR